MPQLLNPGRLRHQITWQRKNVSGIRSSFGDDIAGDPAYLNVVTCKAEIASLEGRELEAARQLWSEARYKITQHYYAGLTTDLRISWYIGGEVKTLDVLDIQDPLQTARVQIIYAKDHIE
jgi:head-tail adaptor